MANETTQLLNEMWDNLRNRCCVDPQTAVRVSMLTPEKFKQAMKQYAQQLVHLKSRNDLLSRQVFPDTMGQ